MNRKIAGLIKDVPLFFGLRQAEIATFLNICKLDTWEGGQTLCECNASSNHLFILLQGKLEIVDPNDHLLAVVAPVSTVGEMGFISRRPRSAKVRIATTSQLLQVEYHVFEALLEGRANLRAKIYRNTIRVLADRLTDANDLLVRYKKMQQTQSLPPEDADESGEDIHIKETESTALAATEARALSDLAAANTPEVEMADSPQASAERHADLVRSFYAQLNLAVDPVQFAEDCAIAAQIHADGYTYADLQYVIRWTVRNIPSARRFNMVRLSIEEAFKDQWDI